MSVVRGIVRSIVEDTVQEIIPNGTTVISPMENNGGFNVSLSPWLTFTAGAGVAEWDGADGYRALGSAKIDSDGSSTQIYQTGVCQTGNRYRVTLYGKSDVNGTTLQIFIGSGTQINVSLPTQWTRFAVEGVTSGNTNLIIRSSSATATVWFDDVILSNQ